MVPLNPRLTAVEASYVLEHSGSRTIVLDAALAPIVDAHADSHGLPLLRLGGSATGDAYESALAAAAPVDPAVEVEERDPFCIAYTSGTTGRPKGVVISHRSRALTFMVSALEWGLDNGRVSAAVAPMYHGAGFAFGYAPVHTGGTVSMLGRWDPGGVPRPGRAGPRAVGVPHPDPCPGAPRPGRRGVRQPRPVQPGHPLLQRRGAALGAEGVGDGALPPLRGARALRLDRVGHHHQPAPRPHARAARLGRPPVVPDPGADRRRRPDARSTPASPASCSAARRT